MGPRFRTSAWLPPGLALGWLAVLATFAHSVGSLLTTWAATVSLVVLSVRWLPDVSPSSRSKTTSDQEEGVACGAAHSASAAENAATSGSRSPDSTSAPSSEAKPAPSGSAPESAPDRTVSVTAGQAEQLGTAEVAVTLGLRVLTAAEAASVLRVDADVIITAIGNGELPGNRIGSHWRVEQGALVHWLQGKYGDLTGSARSPSPTEPGTGPT